MFTATPPSTFHTAGRRYRVTTKRQPQERWGKTKVFVFGTHDIVDQLLPKRPPYSHKGDDPLVDEAWKAYNRTEVAVQRAVLEHVASGKFGFGRKVGCSCGCSPGFRAATENPMTGFDLFIHVEPF